jgi:hypothetical protein
MAGSRGLSANGQVEKKWKDSGSCSRPCRVATMPAGRRVWGAARGDGAVRAAATLAARRRSHAPAPRGPGPRRGAWRRPNAGRKFTVRAAGGREEMQGGGE